MITKETIDSALTAHSLWKNRLYEAINNGQSEFKVETVMKDDACAFGQWLGTVQGEAKNVEILQKVKSLHTEFHKVAAEILKLALTGKKEEALKKLERGGGYGNISGKLILTLNDWKGKL